MQWASRAGPRRYWPSLWPLPRPPKILDSCTRRSVMRISEWPVEPCMVSTSRTSVHPSEGMSIMKAVLAPREPSGTSSSVRAMRMAKLARRALEMNHLCPLITHSSPSLTAKVLIRVGSDPATSGSVMAKQLMTRPSRSGRRYCSFCSSVAQCRSVCMLPSSGAWQLRIQGPRRVLAASDCTMARSTWPRPMPPHSFGMWGSQRPSALACSRSPKMIFRYSLRDTARSSSPNPETAGMTVSWMNVRTFRRMASVAGSSVKSMGMVLLWW